MISNEDFNKALKLFEEEDQRWKEFYEKMSFSQKVQFTLAVEDKWTNEVPGGERLEDDPED
ncbi:hypothetical protein A7K93_06860 [Candidatus Methylacidiphilum fumarolicum]|uniref:Uncharacterized protein n=2 Tax=Candidatus Methylacidiphilum fumarolicum TaxID=591154 RepID=I0K010_METFB|nr:hypothetical protein [Candidatus Methylacidiphilum fumarolicum]MBW6415146.1 hypothetical protein [Candidatus Methylacidiphilum fumarolicum]TFE65974.1 hypothetical protein A7K73_02095 [Candidatus Methylacidiphilum fumarolicum]TFE72706.1 hypothetical protein A7K72_08020 [Candidatus Methylacidiphilum fumarolicum]TFE73171.1 hypothetical protein A7K93_06860 [Candidatus Methylacidiphilum fumarolicum]TFE77574.1 hypothetical protein A7D33_04165 [Candidatus Methylacidiphilum fumarolicum]